MIKAKLLVVGGETESNEIRLELPASLGRGRDVTVSLSHPLISRHHCEIYESNGRLRVRDLDSLNGTFVGSQRVTSDAELAPGDLLTIGTVTFRAVYDPEKSDGPAVSGDSTTKLEGIETVRMDPGKPIPSPRPIDNRVFRAESDV